jgi:hypothetical protein
MWLGRKLAREWCPDCGLAGLTRKGNDYDNNDSTNNKKPKQHNNNMMMMMIMIMMVMKPMMN